MLSSMIASKRPSVEQSSPPVDPFSRWLPRLTFVLWCPVAAGELQQIAIERRAKVEGFQRKHRTGLLTLLFTDIVDYTALKQGFGDREAVPVMQRRHAAIREILGQFSESEEN
jgi:class 3 adenylate cyclase